MQESRIPEDLPDNAVVPWDLFLVYLSHFAKAGAEDKLIWTALVELGLDKKDTFTGAEMRAVERAIAILVQAGLDSSEDPETQKYARIFAAANHVFAKHASPR
jgi:hypothetical protein